MSTALDDIKPYFWTDVQGSTISSHDEFITLLLIDASVNFDYIKSSNRKWREDKQKFSEEGSPVAHLPYMKTIDGKLFSNTLSFMRCIRRKLGKYDGKTEEEKLLVGDIADTTADWYAKWVEAYFGGNEEASKKYKEEYLVEQLKRHEKYLSKTTGPYLLGEEHTYADFYLFYILEDNSMPVDAKELTHVTAFVKAIENRPNLKKYLASNRK